MTTISTTRFGEIEIHQDHLIEFRDGMIGFPKLKKYVLVESPSMPLILWLQAVGEPDIAFPLIEPWFFKRDYKANMTDADRHSLGYEDGDSTKIFVVLTIPEDMNNMTVNLKAPLVIDLAKASATQVILQDKGLEVRSPAHEAFNKALSNYTISQTASVFDDDSTESWAAVDFKRQGEASASV